MVLVLFAKSKLLVKYSNKIFLTKDYETCLLLKTMNYEYSSFNFRLKLT